MATTDPFRLLAAGFIYIVSPGPVFLGILGIVSEKGRKAGTLFASGAFLGDVVWLVMTCLFLIGASRVPELFLTLLSSICALYLFWLGYKMIAAARSSRTDQIFPRPFRSGLSLGLLNPKSYPVLISVFSVFVLSDNNPLTLSSLPFLMLFSSLGFIIGYGAMVTVSGITSVRSIYVRNLKAFSIGFGLIFIGFGVKLLSLIRF